MKRLISFLLLTAALPANAGTTTVDDRGPVGVTIYADFALVRDSRPLKLSKGEATLEFPAVSAQIQPETAILKAPGLSVLEQNFDFDLLTRQRLLEKAVGTKVKLYRADPNSTADKIEEAEVLSAADGEAILKIGDRIEAIHGDLPGRLVFDKLPPNLRPKPTLSLKVDADKAISGNADLTYLSGGLGWSADYVGTLSADEKSLILKGFVTLTNNSGADYKDAQVQLVAGDVGRVRDQVFLTARKAAMPEAMAAPPPPQEEGLLDYHLYTLPHRTDVLDKQTKQVTLLDVPTVAVRKHYRYPVYNFATIQDFQPAEVTLEFDNTKASGLGLPLPAGTFRVYASDSAGRPQFVGEDNIRHTPEGEDVKLTMGRAFDVTVTPTLKNRRNILDGKQVAGFTADMSVKVKNAKGTPVTVAVEQSVPVRNMVVAESLKHTSLDAGRIAWQVPVGAKSETVLTYSVEVRYRDN